MVLPTHRGRGAGDRDTTFLLQVHVVHGGTRTITVDLLHLVNATRIEKDTFAESRFARVDMGRDTDVASFRGISSWWLVKKHERNAVGTFLCPAAALTSSRQATLHWT